MGRLKRLAISGIFVAALFAGIFGYRFQRQQASKRAVRALITTYRAMDRPEAEYALLDAEAERLAGDLDDTSTRTMIALCFGDIRDHRSAANIGTALGAGAAAEACVMGAMQFGHVNW